MAKHIAADEPFERSELPASEAIERFRAEDAALQGRADRGPGPRRGRRDRLAIPQRLLRRPLPRAARAVDRADQGVQALLDRRRLLARRREPADADPDLWHRVSLPGGPRAPSGAARAGARERPSPARSRARPVHVPAGGAGDAVLAAERDHPHAAHQGRGPRAAAPSAATSRSRRRGCSTRSSGTARGTGTTTARTCSSSSRRRARATSASYALKPMNCPGACLVFALGPPLIPRAAAAPGRVRRRVSLRARGRPARAAARARVHPGRRARLLHARAGRRRGRLDLRGDRRALRAVRLRRGPGRALDAARTSRSAPTSSGRRPRRRLREALERQGREYERQPGGGDVLRAEDRLPRHRRARALMAAAAPASSTFRCRSASTSATRGRTTPSTGP